MHFCHHRLALHPHGESVRSMTMHDILSVVKILMSDAAGAFQIDELLKPRIEKSGLKEYFHVTAEISCNKNQQIIEKFEI